MTKEELEKEAEGWLNKWELCNKCENKVNCISNFSYCKKVVLQSYLAGAEPREKRIAELEETIKRLQKQILEFTRELHKSNKENAELKESCKIQVDTAFQMIYEKDEQLTKAKEIIKKLISDNHKVWVYSDVREEAEQFLKENSTYERIQKARYNYTD